MEYLMDTGTFSNAKSRIKSVRFPKGIWLSFLLLLPTIWSGKIQEFNENTKGQNRKQDIRCKEEADKLFEKFVENLAINLTYDSLFDDIKHLQCVFFYIDEKTRSNENLGDNNCASKIRVNLDTKKLVKVKDWNIEDVEALLRYRKLFIKPIPSLKNVEDLLKYVPSNQKLKVKRTLQNVTKNWKNLRNDMRPVIKIYKKCKIPFSKNATVIPSDIIVPYDNKTILRFEKYIPKEEIAASVFKQMLEVKNFMLKDLIHRWRCLS